MADVTSSLNSMRLNEMIRGTWGSMQIQLTGSAMARQIDRKNRRVLMATGGYGRRVMRGLLGKKKPKAKKPPKKFNRRGEVTPRYLEWLKRQRQRSSGSRPPYQKKGTLRNLTFFAVNERQGTVLIGPAALESKNVVPMGGIRSGAQLLSEGGPAKIRISDGKGKVAFISRKYRPHPYRAPTLEKTLPIFRSNMARF